MPEAWFDTTALAALLTTVKGANKIWLIDTYSIGDSRATIFSNRCAEAVITTGDFTGPVSEGNDQKLTFDGITGTATKNSVNTNFHIALVDDNYVLAITDETSDQVITSGNPVAFPIFDMYSRQPTLMP